MNELIKVTVNERHEQTVSARELHERLGVQKDFTSWFKYQAEKIGIVENEDYYLLTNFGEQNGSGGHNKIDYIITIDTAKHLTMISGGDKAHEIRRYFIEVEKAWNNPELVMARSLQFAQTKLLEYQNQIEQLKPKAEYAEKMLKAKDNILVREFAKVLCDEGFKIGEKKLYQWLKDNKYLMLNKEPYQRYIDNNTFVIKSGSFETPFGTKQSRTTLITPQGQLYLFRKITNKSIE